MSSEIETRIIAWFAEQPDAAGFELESLTVRQHGRRSTVDAVIDGKDRPITMDECGRWNRRLADHLEAAGFFAGPYLVEVSSPGVDRPMTAPRHFQRALGRKLKVRYQDAAGTVREIIGRLNSADGSSAVLQAEQEEITLPYERILQARQEVTFSKEER